MNLSFRGPQRRSLELDSRAAESDSDNRITLAFASEEPVSRWYGDEILDVRAGSVRLDRLRNKAALLLNHDPDRQIGVVETVSLGADRVARATVRFSQSGEAQAVLRDIRDGIRSKVSVGYRVHEIEREGIDGETSTFRATDWEPYEISIVSVPADDTVGVGRSLDTRSDDPIMEAQNLSRRERKLLAAGELDQPAIEQRAEKIRRDEIAELGAMWPDLGGPELARAASLDPSMTVDAFRQTLLAKLNSRGAAPTVTGRVEAPQAHGVPFGQGARNILPGRLGPFQTERAAYGFGQFLKAQMPDGEQARRWMRDNYGEQQRAISSTGQGGVLIPTEVSSEIIQNLDSYGVARREARLWRMQSEALTVPVNTSRPTAYFTAPGTEVTTSDPGFGEVGLYAKQLVSSVVVNRETMQDAVIDLASFVGQSLSEAFAYTEDACLFTGDATSTYGGMTGLPNALAAGSIMDAAAGHDTFTEVDLTDATNLMAKLPAYAIPEAKFFCSSAVYLACLMQSAINGGWSSNNISDVEKGFDLMRPKFLGFPVVLVPNMPSDPTATYNGGAPILYFGAMRRAVAFGDRQIISLTVDPYTLAGKSQIRIVGYSRFDCVVHGIGTATAAGPIVGMRGKT